VIDNQIDWYKWLNHAGLLAELLYCGTHGSEIDAERYSREILKQDARDHEGDLSAPLGIGLPRSELSDISLFDPRTINVPEYGLKHDTN
jgi:hypothetical protein